MLVLNETEHARDNTFTRDNTIVGRRAVSGDNNKIAAKMKLNALNREFLKSLGFIVRKK